MNEPYRVIRDSLREELVREVGRHRYRLWFRDTEIRNVDEVGVTLAVPTEVHRTWLECTYAPQLQRAVDSVFGEGMEIRLLLSRLQGRKRALRERLPARPQEWEALLEKRRPRPTLDSFVCDRGERFPKLLLSQFVHGNGAVDPPAVYLYGENGTGKSHLLRALQQAVDAQGPGQAIHFTSRAFTTRYVSALRMKDLNAVRAFEVDFSHRRLVLLDDVHELAGRKATQQALVRLREQAVGGRTRFVCSGACHPRELTGFSSRLSSWLMTSVILRLPNPRRERLELILDERAKAYGLSGVEDDVLTWIREKTGSVRGAVEVLDRWAASSAELGVPLGREWLDEIAPAVSVTAREEITRRAKQAVADYFGIPVTLLERPTKARRAREPRRIAIYLVYRATALPLTEIGGAFGLRSHSSVSRAIQQIRQAREVDPALEQVIDGLLSRM